MDIWSRAENIIIPRNNIIKMYRDVLDDIANMLDKDQYINIDFAIFVKPKVGNELNKRLQYSRYYGHINDDNDYLFLVPLIEDIKNDNSST